MNPKREILKFKGAAIAMAALAAFLVPSARSASQQPLDDSFFVKKLYPVFEKAQCRLCHNDNGVASKTRFQFPPAGASDEQIRRFGLRLGLLSIVDRENPELSLLYHKPTNRIRHTGGERIPKDGEQEKLLLAWIRHVARLPADKIAELTEDHEPSGHRTARPHTIRRLTHSQYNNTVRDLLGELSRPADRFPQEDFIHGFKNQAHGQGTPPLLMEAYSEAAERVARNAFRGGDTHGLIPCQPRGPGDAECYEKFVREFGLRAFRRPLSEGELQNYRDLALTDGKANRDFLAGAQIVIETMLQAPSFLFRLEYGPGGPWEAYENASKLSFSLWNTTPDDWLLGLAENGELLTPAQIEAAARTMLGDPRARPAMREFLSQWMRFDRVEKAIRDRRRFPEFNSELAGAMTEETRRLFEHLVWNDGDFREFFNARYTFLNGDLAKIYGLPVPPKPFGRVEFPEDTTRAGVLGHASFLTLTSKPSDTSPTERGLFVREHFLCQIVPPPPPGVNASLPPLTDERPMTNRERLQVHLNSEACSSCHRLIDPIGFGLERFDAIGRFRQVLHIEIPPTRDEQKRKLKTEATKYDLELDTSAEVFGLANGKFSTLRELGGILAQEPACQKCVVKQAFRYAMGRQETAADETSIEQALTAFRQSRFRFRELLVAIVTSPSFLGGAS